MFSCSSDRGICDGGGDAGCATAGCEGVTFLTFDFDFDLNCFDVRLLSVLSAVGTASTSGRCLLSAVIVLDTLYLRDAPGTEWPSKERLSITR